MGLKADDIAHREHQAVVEVAHQSLASAVDDIALNVFSKEERGHLNDPIDPAAERRVVRKIDMFVIPFICVTYLITYIDKATIGYAAVYGMKEDLHLKSGEYSWLSSIFYFGYLAFEYPTSHAMQKLSVPKWLAANIFLWGGITMALGGCKQFSSFATLRFILGALESCSTPAFLLITSMWYKVEEQPVRIGWWSTFLGLASAFGGLLGFGIGHIHGALNSWQYQFIIIGGVSSIWGIFMFFFLADNATTAVWLTADEKKVAVERLRDNQTGMKSTKVKPYQIWEALLDPKTWLLFLLSVATQAVNGFVSNFGSLTVRGFGFSSLNSTLLQVPYGFIILVSNVSAMYIQRWLPGQMRCLVGSLYVLPPIAGTVGMHVIPRDKQGALLACYYLTAIYTASYSMIMSLLTANIAGSTKRTTVNAIFFIAYCVGNIISPFSFKDKEAPAYISGIICVLVAFCCEVGLLIVFAFYAMFLNKQKAKTLAQLEAENRADEEGRALAGFSDLTDKENPYFRYTY